MAPAEQPWQEDERVEPIGRLALAAGHLDQARLESALAQQAEEPLRRPLGQILLERGWLAPGELLALLRRQMAQTQVAYRDHPESSPVLIRLRGLRKELDGRLILDDVDIDIPAHRITAIIGVSGTGKSVTLKHMIGLMRPDSGEVWVGDQELGHLSAKELNQVRQRFGMLFQGGALFDSLSVVDNVAFPLRENTRLPEEEIQRRVEASLAAVNLPGMEGKFPDELSGGMLKRVALARALVTDPEVLLLDEPTAGLDPIIENAIHHLICDTYLRARYTMVFISHSVPEIFKWCHHVVVIHAGRVRAAGPALTIQASDDPVIRQFINGELEGPIKVL